MGGLPANSLTGASTADVSALVGGLPANSLTGATGSLDTAATFSGASFDFASVGALTSPWQIPSNQNCGQTPIMPVSSSGTIKSDATKWSVAQYNAALNNNQFAQADIFACSGTAGYGVAIRCRCGALNWDGYKLVTYNLSGVLTVVLTKTSGNASAALSAYTLSDANGYAVPGGIGSLPITVRLEVSGTTISAYVNGTLRVQGTDSSLTSGLAGLWIDPTNGSQSSLDNLVIGNL